MTVIDRQSNERANETDQAATSPEGDPGGVADPQAEMNAVVAQRDDYLEQLQRSRADFANFRRRVEGERSQAREFATRALLTQIVPVLDDLQRALAIMPEEQAGMPWAQGVVLIEKKLQTILDREGVLKVESLGMPFDPAVHEAVATDPGSTENVVVEVYQPGYRHGQSLLRPAMVKVGDKQAFNA